MSFYAALGVLVWKQKGKKTVVSLHFILQWNVYTSHMIVGRRIRHSVRSMWWFIESKMLSGNYLDLSTKLQYIHLVTYLVFVRYYQWWCNRVVKALVPNFVDCILCFQGVMVKVLTSCSPCTSVSGHIRVKFQSLMTLSLNQKTGTWRVWHRQPAFLKSMATHVLTPLKVYCMYVSHSRSL